MDSVVAFVPGIGAGGSPALDGQVVDALRASCSVPQSLQRDYVVLVLLAQALDAPVAPNHTHVYASVAASVERLLSLPPVGDMTAVVRSHTRPSLQQTVGYVFGKAVGKFYGALGNVRETISTHDVQYTKLPAWVPGTKGIAATEAGRSAFVAYLHAQTAAMQFDGVAFAKRWFPSRSAKSHARRKQFDAKRVTGLSAGSSHK